MNSIHISEARRIFSRKEPVDITIVTSKGEIQTYRRAMPMKADFYGGFRNFKLQNGQIRKVRDTLIIAVNDIEVYI